MESSQTILWYFLYRSAKNITIERFQKYTIVCSTKHPVIAFREVNPVFYGYESWVWVCWLNILPKKGWTKTKMSKPFETHQKRHVQYHKTCRNETRWVKITKSFFLITPCTWGSKFRWSIQSFASPTNYTNWLDQNKHAKTDHRNFACIGLANCRFPLAQITTNNQPEEKHQTCTLFFFQICPLQHVGNFPKFETSQKTSNVGQQTTRQTREDQKRKFWILDTCERLA